MKLYKFINSKLADDMLTRGIVRIGIGAEFRLPDGKTGGRADEKEMKVVWRPPAGTVTIDKNHPFLRDLDIAKSMVEGEKKTMTYAKGVVFILHADAHIYCTSHEMSSDLRDRMQRDFGADACIVIEDAGLFVATISAHPFLAGRQYYGDIVRYTKKDSNAHYPANDPFEKTEEFEWQKEFRFVWLGDKTLKPEIITAPSIIALLRQLY